MLVAIGSTMFCVTALRIAGAGNRAAPGDPGGRLGGGLVGAATVLKQQNTVTGVNVAASIWTTAAIGCEVGMGDLWVALLIAPAVGLVSWGRRAR